MVLPLALMIESQLLVQVLLHCCCSLLRCQQALVMMMLVILLLLLFLSPCVDMLTERHSWVHLTLLAWCCRSVTSLRYTSGPQHALVHDC